MNLKSNTKRYKLMVVSVFSFDNFFWVHKRFGIGPVTGCVATSDTWLGYNWISTGQQIWPKPKYGSLEIIGWKSIILFITSLNPSICSYRCYSEAICSIQREYFLKALTNSFLNLILVSEIWTFVKGNWNTVSGWVHTSVRRCHQNSDDIQGDPKKCQVR